MSSDRDDPPAFDPERLTIQQWLELLSGIAFGPGLVDVVTIGPDPRFERASNFVCMGLSLHNDKRARVFDTACVLSPPTWPDSVDLRAVVSSQLRELEHPPDQARGHVDRVDHRKLSRLDSEELLNELRSCPDRSIIYVPSAAHFRYSGAVEGMSDEEFWVTQLLRLARDARAVVDTTGSYVLLDAGRFTPTDLRAKKLLAELECGLVGAGGSSEDIGRLHAIVTGVGKGDARALSEALAAIAEAETRLGPDAASLQRAIAFYNSGRHLAVWPVLSPHWKSLLDHTSSIPESRVELARLAAAGGVPDEARRALASFEVDTADVGLLEKALLVSSACNDQALEAKVIERLEHVFPRSRALSQHLVRGRLRTGDYEALAKFLSEAGDSIDPEERSYLTDVVVHLGRSTPDYVSATDALIVLHPGRESAIRLLVAREAARHSDHIAALELCTSIDPDTADGSQATQLAIDVLESVLLLRAEGGSFIVPDMVLARLSAFLAKRIATEPNNAILRRSFSRALSIEVLGTRGTTILVYLLMARTSKPELVPRRVSNDVDESEIQKFVDIAINQVKASTNVAIGTGDLPDSFDIERARRLLSLLPKILEWLLDNIRDEHSILAMQIGLHTALLVCKRAGDELLGMMLFQMAAIHLATTGWAQLARDMAEHALLMAGNDAAELRVAWGTFADVYHRIGNIHEALIGALCAISFSEAPIGAAEAWLEDYLLTRLLRDLGLWDEAEAVLGRAVEALGPLTPAQTVHIESLRLSIEHCRLKGALASDERILALVQSLTANLRHAVDLEYDVPPPLILLVQLIARARSRGLDVASETDDLVQRAMSLVPPNLTELVSAFGMSRPTLADIQSLTKGLSKTRGGSDVAYDIKNTSLFAKRTLAQADQIPSDEVLPLLELLSDRTLVDLSGRELIDPPRIREAVAHLLRDDHDVHVMAFDERDRLVRLTFSQDRPETLVFEPEVVFSATRLDQWKQELPFKYAFMDHDEHIIGDAVRRSVDHLGISEPPRRSAVVVCDVTLQPFPMNLLRYQDEFVGALHPITMAPSLDWIANITEKPRLLNGRRNAWVSDALPADDLSRSVLAPLTDRLEPVLAERGVMLTRAEHPPPELEDADLAIVLAHGGLVPGQRFFQVLRDDHDQQWAPRKIGWALGAAGIVVLFVCSSGRLDEHPGARATIGLTRHLLGNGCRAVVACPWPLAVLVPPRWLPPFLDALNQGARVTDAVFAANQELVLRFSGNPPHAFAMHLYGDPSFRLK